MEAIFHLRDALPTTEDVLALEPEELAGIVLFALKSSGANMLSRHNFLMSVLSGTFNPYPTPGNRQVAQALSEAWAWLERECLVVPDADQGDWSRISRRGAQISTLEDFTSYRQAAAFPRSLLHPIIEQEAWQSFARGKFDTAVFEAFREVEIAVRRASQFEESSHGLAMFRRAFHKESGPLTSRAADDAEREGMSNLFAGAYGSYRNSVSHRRLGRLDAREAGEVLILASHLLRIVEDREAVRHGREVAESLLKAGEGETLIA